MSEQEIGENLNDPFATAVLRKGIFPDSVDAIVTEISNSLCPGGRVSSELLDNACGERNQNESFSREGSPKDYHDPKTGNRRLLTTFYTLAMLLTII